MGRLTAMLVALVAGLLVAGFWLAGATRPWLEQSLSEVLGRPVRILGAVRPLVSLYPGLVLGDVRIENPPGSTEPVLLEVAAFGARLDLPALLRRELRVRGLRLHDGRLVVGGSAPAGEGREAVDPRAQLALLRSLAGEQRLRNLRVEVVLEDGSRSIVLLEQARLRACGEPAQARASLGATAIELKGTLVCEPDGTGVRDAVARIGESELRGRVTLRFRREGLRVEGDADSESLLVDDLLAALGEPPAVASDSALDAPLPFDWFEDVDLDLGLRAEALYADAGVVRELKGRLTSEAGELRASVERALVAGGTLSGELRVGSRPEPPVAALNLFLDGIDLALLAPHVFEEGTAILDLDLRGAGATLGSLLAGADGRSQLTVSDALLTRATLGVVGRDLFSLLRPKKEAERDRRVHCAVLRGSVEAGAVALHAILDTPDVSLAGGGSLDLEARSADVLLKPRPRRASLGAVKTPIRISGPLEALRVAVDKGELARTTGKALGFALLNPLVALVDLGVRGNPCQETIDLALGEFPADAGPAPPPATSAPGPADGPLAELEARPPHPSTERGQQQRRESEERREADDVGDGG
jgi:hypothetical protein